MDREVVRDDDLVLDVASGRAAQHTAKPCEQLLDPDRLAEVVVGTGVQNGDLVAFVGAVRDHDDRHVGTGAELAHGPGCSGAAGGAGRTWVENERLDQPSSEKRRDLPVAVRDGDAVAAVAQRRCYETT
jgi:hypothetical protein